ncbi:MAG: 3-isopropylmalate dehydratase small subunit [Bacillota bacterium]
MTAAAFHLGRVWKYGAHVDTDVIIPARYLTTHDPEVLRLHCLEDLDPSFKEGVRPGDILVALENFGCGSSREHAPLALKAAGVYCVVAVSFARIFFRNSINIGLPVLECPQLARAVATGDELQVDMTRGELVHQGRIYSAQAYPEFMREIIAAGGLVPYVQQQLAGGGLK